MLDHFFFEKNQVGDRWEYLIAWKDGSPSEWMPYAFVVSTRLLPAWVWQSLKDKNVHLLHYMAL
jgi:hypothetical protein